MLGMQKTIERLVRELEAERVENARFRRMMEDLLYNLEEENMPSVGTRLQRDEQSIGLLVEDGRVRGGVLVEAINGATAVTIDADKIALDGKLEVDAINGATAVSIDADKIDLNGAVTANDNFKIHKDGSVSCRALSLTGGEICLPDPGDGSAVLRVETEDAAGGVTVFADHIAFDGSFTEDWQQQADLSLEQLMLTNEAGDGTGATIHMGGYYRPGSLRLTRKDIPAGGLAGEEDEAIYTARGITLPFLRAHPVAKTAGMLPLYVDENGKICAVTGG